MMKLNFESEQQASLARSALRRWLAKGVLPPRQRPVLHNVLLKLVQVSRDGIHSVDLTEQQRHVMLVAICHQRSLFLDQISGSRLVQTDSRLVALCDGLIDQLNVEF